MNHLQILLLLKSSGAFFVSGFSILAFGVWLRFWRVGSFQVFADEIHTIQCASEKSFLWNVTHFASNDACIPYTLYNKLLLETIGLTELTLRLPAVLAGILLLGVVFWYGRKYANSAVALVATGFISVSPYFVYISREARPYSIIMLLVTWAGFILMDKKNCQRLKPLCAVSAMLALAAYFHPIVIPAVAVVWLLPVILCAGSPDLDSGWSRNYVVATMVGIGIGIITLGPAIPSFFEGMVHKGGLGKADIQTARQGLLLIHGMPVFIPIWVWILVAVGGLIGCVNGWLKQGTMVLIVVIVQLLSIHMFHPQLNEVPWVWLRYWIHVFPLVLVVFGVGISQLLKPLGKVAWVIAPCCMLMIGGYSYYHLTTGNYGISQADTYPVHPMVMMLNRMTVTEHQVPIIAFYKKMIAHLDTKSVIIESPIIYTFPLYGRYSLVHRHKIKTAGVEPGFAQMVLETNNNFTFQTIFRPNQLDVSNKPVYWIHHYNIKKELSDWLAVAESDPYARFQLESVDFLMKNPLVDNLFGTDEVLERFTPPGGKLIYQDDFVKLFQISTI